MLDGRDITIVRDAAVMTERYLQAQRAARRECRLLDGPPGSDETVRRRQAANQTDRMAAGVRYRTIYAHDTLWEVESGLAALRMVERGAQARTLPRLPARLVVADDAVAVLSPTPDGPGLILRHSPALTALITVFDTLWSSAVPVAGRLPDNPGKPGEPDELDRLILLMMSSGATDDAIARRLNVSRRTVVRRTSAVLLRLGATNRFQAGAQAARLGWL